MSIKDIVNVANITPTMNIATTEINIDIRDKFTFVLEVVKV